MMGFSHQKGEIGKNRVGGWGTGGFVKDLNGAMQNGMGMGEFMCERCDTCEGIIQCHEKEVLQQIHNIVSELLQRDGIVPEVWCLLMKCMEYAQSHLSQLAIGAEHWFLDEINCSGPNVGGHARFTMERMGMELKLWELVKSWPKEHWEG